MAEANPKFYRDYAQITEAELEAAGWNCTIDTSKSPTFTERLHYLLGELEKDEMQHIASWQPHGRSFMVHRRHEFERDHLPLYVHCMSDRLTYLTSMMPHILLVFLSKMVPTNKICIHAATTEYVRIHVHSVR